MVNEMQDGRYRCVQWSSCHNSVLTLFSQARNGAITRVGLARASTSTSTEGACRTTWLYNTIFTRYTGILDRVPSVSELLSPSGLVADPCLISHEDHLGSYSAIVLPEAAQHEPTR